MKQNQATLHEHFDVQLKPPTMSNLHPGAISADAPDFFKTSAASSPGNCYYSSEPTIEAKYDYIPARVELNKTVPITCEENILQQDLQAQKELNRKRSDIRCDVANAVKVKAFNRTRNTIDHNETRSAGRRQHFADSYEVRHSNLQSRCGDAVFRRHQGELTRYLEEAYKRRNMTPSQKSHLRLSSLAETLPSAKDSSNLAGKVGGKTGLWMEEERRLEMMREVSSCTNGPRGTSRGIHGKNKALHLLDSSLKSCQKGYFGSSVSFGKACGGVYGNESMPATATTAFSRSATRSGYFDDVFRPLNVSPSSNMRYQRRPTRNLKEDEGTFMLPEKPISKFLISSSKHAPLHGAGGGGLGTGTGAAPLHLPRRAYSSVRNLQTPLCPLQSEHSYSNTFSNESKTRTDDIAKLSSNAVREKVTTSTQLQRDSQGNYIMPEDDSFWSIVKSSNSDRMRLIRTSHLSRAMLQSRYLARQAPEEKLQLNHKFFTRGDWAELGLNGITRNENRERKVSPKHASYSVVDLYNKADEIYENDMADPTQKTAMASPQEGDWSPLDSPSRNYKSNDDQETNEYFGKHVDDSDSDEDVDLWNPKRTFSRLDRDSSL